MGMMNVLMQLRKVCNHPDLFEPRSVITPFIVDSIVLPMAMCVSEMSDRSSALDELSCSLVSPLWSGSEDRPSIHAGLRHDTVESDELLKLEASLDVPLKSLYDATTDDVSSALGALAEAVRDREHQDHVDNTLFLNFLNARRCRASPCPFSHRLVDLVLVPKPPLQHQETDCLSTPSHLLAMRRDQMQRANDMNVLIKRFVFAVPKVGARRVVMDSNRNRSSYQNESTLSEILWEPLEACLRPFRNAHTRLTSFFPDKELVQFDAGKLQALAELLRERKRGGHKVLIFTQMSKMLDILEAFLNMNGHTYVRLDGGTSIDQRQRLMDRFNSDPKIFCFILSTRSGGTGVNLVGADTVVFYDSDWNPAQDAQAQDRAHR